MRSIVLVFSLFAVLACPYECAVRQALASQAENRVDAACCDRCAARKLNESANNQIPASPQNDEDSRPCFCEGAVFDVADRATVSDSLNVFLWVWVVSVDAQFDPCQPPLSLERSDLPPLDGRQTRIEMGSLRL